MAQVPIKQVVDFQVPSVTEVWVKQSGYMKPGEERIYVRTFQFGEEPWTFDGPFVVQAGDGNWYGNSAWAQYFQVVGSFSLVLRYTLRKGSVHKLWKVTEPRMVAMLRDTDYEPRNDREAWVMNRDMGLLWELDNVVHLLRGVEVDVDDADLDLVEERVVLVDEDGNPLP